MKSFKIFLVLPLLAMLACGNKAESNQDQSNTSAHQQEQGVFEDIGVEQFAQLLSSENAFVLDVRTPKEWDQGFIEGAHFMNYYDKDFKEQLNSLNKTDVILVYCKVGGRSGSAMGMMKELGFSEVYNLNSGIDGWKAAGMSIEK